MLRDTTASIAVTATLAAFAAPALAVQACELNGEHVNPSNGNTTAGKTGLMRCREGVGGPVVREQDGRLHAESVYDDRGRVTRERELDAAGQVVRDDEVFEDGSRKAFGK